MNRKVVFLWSPSHVGIQWNEYVDKLASDINKSDEPLPDYKSFAFRGQEIRQKVIEDWSDIAGLKYKVKRTPVAGVPGVPDKSTRTCHSAYLGYGLWWDEGLKPRTTGKSPFLSLGKVDLSKTNADGEDKTYEELAFPTKIRNKEVARFTRVITEHFPSGEYKKRFKLLQPGESDKCPCRLRNRYRETRDHILFKCPYYMRHKKYERKPFVGPFSKRDLAQGKSWYSRRQRGWSSLDVLKFLQLNPMVGTFEWAEILSKCKEDRAQGNEHTMVWARLEAHTVWRAGKVLEFQKEWDGLSEKERKRTEKEAHRKYAAAFDPSKAEKFAEELYRSWQYRDAEEIQEGRREALERNEIMDEPFVHIPIRGVMEPEHIVLGEEVVPPSQAEEHEIAPVNHEDLVLNFAPRVTNIRMRVTASWNT